MKRHRLGYLDKRNDLDLIASFGCSSLVLALVIGLIFVIIEWMR